VDSFPLIATDPSGLWKARDHASQTGRSYVNSDVAASWGRGCRRIVVAILIEANLGQDAGSAPGGPSTDPGEQNHRHFVRRPWQGQSQAKDEYKSYLQDERSRFASNVANGTSDSCLEALRALGRLTHSWQDFYAHAVKNSHPILPLWGTGADIGDPHAPGFDVKPPSWSWPFGGEHGLWSEPADRDGAHGAMHREVDSVFFVIDQYRAMLPHWYEKCKCFCERWMIVRAN
jgi:hypothetical protein